MCWAYNLDDAEDVKHVGGPFATQTEAEAEAERLERSLQSDSRYARNGDEWNRFIMKWDDLPNAHSLGLTVGVLASLGFTYVLGAGFSQGEHHKQSWPSRLD